MAFPPSSSRAQPRKLPFKLANSLGSATPILRFAERFRVPDRHLKPAAVQGRPIQVSGIKGTPRPA
jgi:hypothetical protein